MNYIKVTYGVGNSFIKSTFEDNSTYVKTSVNSTFIKVAYDGGDAGLDAERLRTKVYNVTGGTLVKGTVVYINGSHGNLPSVAKAIATSDATSAQTFGLVLDDIADNKSGYIILAGKLSDLDTQAIPNGSQLYLSSTVAGTYTTAKQYAPAHLVYIGVVNRSHPTQGEIEVRIANGYEADEIHDFAVRNPSNNDGIFFNSTTSLWEKKQISTALGYTPVPTSRTITINGVSYDLSADRSYTIAAGISGSGTSGQVAFWNGASSLTGVNGLFWDSASGRLGVGTNAPSKTLTVAGDALINGMTVGLGSGGVGTNVVIGPSTFISNTSGQHNVAIAYGALYYNTVGNQNVAIGLSSMVSNSSGDNNVAIGMSSLQGNQNGYNNTAIGYSAGYSTIANSNTVGANNIFIGFESIGESSIESNRTWIGNTATTSTWVGGNLLVGTRTNGSEKFQVVGDVSFGSNFFWGNSNSRLGIGTKTPQDQVHIANSASGVNTILRLSVNPNHANIISFRNADGTGQGGFLATGSTFSYGTYIPNQTNLSGGAGGIGLRVANTATSSLVVYGGNADSDFSTKYLQVFGNTGNVLIQNAGTYSDTGERLQVTGNTKIVGAASTSASNGLAVLNSSAVSTFSVRNDGRVSNGDSTFYVDRYVSGSTTMVVGNGGHNNATGIQVTSAVAIRAYSSLGVSSNNLLGASIYAAGGANTGLGNISLGLLSNRALITATASGMGMHVSSMLQVDSTTQGFLPPRMTTTQKNAIATPAAGLVVYDTTLNKLCVYTTTWETITST